MKYKAIIFDFDGVLANTEIIHHQASNQILADLGIIISETEYFEHYAGLADLALLELLEKEKKRVLPNKAQIINTKIAAYKAIIQQLPDMKSLWRVHDFIKNIAKHTDKLGICTSASREEIEITLDKLDHGTLKPYFKSIITIDDVHASKPDPEGYLLSAERLSVSPKDCLVIEDTQKGASAAKAAGMTVVGLTSSHERSHFQNIDFIAESYEEIAEWIKN